MGRVTNNQQTVGDQSYSMGYSYNLGGALISQTYPSGRVVSYFFDDAAPLSQVSSGGTVYANQFDYSSTQGLLKSVALGNGAVESYGYNSRLQTKSLDLTKSGTQLQHYDYKYGVYDSATNTVDETKNNGQIARIEGLISTVKQWQQNFAYDSLGRLSSAREFRGDNNQQSWLVNYDYDVFGNRYQYQSQNANNPFTQFWVESSQINQANNRFNSGVTYDDAGNVTVDSKFRDLQFQYDANNRQKQSANVDATGAVVSVYDAGGQRVATQVAGGLTNVLVYDASGKLLAEYGSPVPGGTQYLFSDHQGSPRAITSSNGSVMSRHDYLPFGEELGAVGMRTSGQGYGIGDNARQKYAGMENDDATGMQHTLWRQYDSFSGRWTAPDPYGGSMSVADPQSFNRYSYVENNPVNAVDPLGLQLADAGIYVVSNYSEQVQLEKALKYDQQIAANASYAAKHGGIVTYDENGHATFRSKYSSNFARNATRNMAAKRSDRFFSGLGLSQGPAGKGDESDVIKINSEPAYLPTVYIWNGQWKFLSNGHFRSTFGHVSYSYGPVMRSWEGGGWVFPMPPLEEFIGRNRYRTADVYVFDFGPTKNRLWWERIESSYDGIAVGFGIGSSNGSGYDLFQNNCAAAFCRSTNVLGLPEVQEMSPSYLKTYIDANMKQYLKRHYTIP